MPSLTTRILTPNLCEIDYLRPDPEALCVQDAHEVLTRATRFGSQLGVTLAEHLSLVLLLSYGRRIDQRRGDVLAVRAYAAAHDLHEYITMDVPKPLKNALPEYVERVEVPWEECVLRSLDLYPVPPDVVAAVKILDSAAVSIEALVWSDHHRDLIAHGGRSAYLEHYFVHHGEPSAWDIAAGQAVRRGGPEQAWTRINNLLDLDGKWRPGASRVRFDGIPS